MAKRKYQRKTYKQKKEKLKTLLKIIISCLFFLVISPVIIFIYYFKDLPRPEDFKEGIIPQSSKIYDREGKVLLYEISGEEKRTLVPLKEIPNYLKWAVITAEDAEFYQHQGVNFKGIIRAILYDLKMKKFAQGGSSISQQLIRSYFLTRKKTLARKTREIILTLELERRYSKNQILEWYLNLIPFGGNIYGVESAAQTFFQKPISSISLAESAILAALIQAPSYYSPFREHKKELLKRKNYILERMNKLGYISDQEKLNAQKEKIKFSKTKNIIKAPHFVMYIRNYLFEKYGKKFLTKKGLKIYTTLDFKLQTLAEKILKEELEKLKIYNAHNGALVVLNPKTGEILTMVGSKDYFGKPFPENCIPGKNCLFDPKVNTTLTNRQPGSAFKPIVYAQAFLKGFTPDTIVWDVKTEFNLNCSSLANQERDQYNQKCYHPKNYDGKYLGPIKLKDALAQSRNLPSVKVLYLTGIKEVLNLAKKLGIKTLSQDKNYGLSLVLGGGEVKLLEMTEAYSVFANDGVKTPLVFIKKIEDDKGNILEEMKTSSFRILPSQIARQINEILSDNKARAPMFGWNSPLHLKNYQVAVKTGTTQYLNDAWTIGYTRSLVVGVWVGNNNNQPTKKPGVALAGVIWNKFMNEILNTLKKETFKKPKKIITKKPILNGVLKEPHSILYFVNKNNPQGPGNSRHDPQFLYWEQGIKNWLKLKFSKI